MVSFYNRAVPSARVPLRDGAVNGEFVLEVTEKDGAVAISLSRPGQDDGRACLIAPEEGVVLIAALEKAVQLARLKRDRAQA